jgi:hypothetical protein
VNVLLGLAASAVMLKTFRWRRHMETEQG